MDADAGGTLTVAAIDRALDECWRPPLRRRILPYGWKWLPFGRPESAGRCTATLFAPDESLMLAIKAELIVTDTPVHPLHLVHFKPQQGPAPLACEREPHPDSPYHWDGHGTWWRA
jgi:hypothetical protein